MKHKKAFSLIELLIGLIIISLVIGAFAPVMNKRTRMQKAAMALKMTTNCSNISPYCLLCYTTIPKRCITCQNECSQDNCLNYQNCTCSTSNCNP